MTAPRTVTVPTLDHGPITIPEPAWCLGHEGHQPEYRVDITHTGSEHSFTFNGHPLLVTMLTQAPCATIGTRDTGLHVEQTGYARTLDPTALGQLAAALVEHAATLRAQARALSALLAQEGK
ncbi:hypothetical protein [Streptomyces sp. H27-C3]|uniref:DUF6907 domain-containing protein n=1 Tax=Streptomyces sp. H27-C3 TaxID=3046305 RepID=UPI0024BAFE09|nr:hypothetical protein [Streptomyces sp. H27-C3]MDJ0461576.1 hypothetical protein [Streptomyces sp. H27-C3]